MIVIDTSSLITLSTATVLPLVLEEYDVHTTETVIQELEETAAYDDTHGEAARAVLENENGITVHRTGERTFQSSRIDSGEGSCALLTRDIDAAFLITDDLRALPELQSITDSNVAISPILLKALVERDVLERDDALEKLDRIADERDWLGAPIYRRARRLFDEDST
jgi:predicted nucleic acid-binding protein